jgi:hypothetical protein
VRRKTRTLVLKLLAVDALSTGTVSSGEVSTLDHELADDPVERRALVVQRLATLADTFLAGAESTEVLRLRTGRRISRNEGKKRRKRVHTVFGTTSAKSSKVTRPALLPLMEISKKTRGLGMSGEG